jgi:hypothetical protein
MKVTKRDIIQKVIILLLAIMCIVFGVLYGSLLKKQRNAENPGDIHGTYKLKGNLSPVTEYITFDTDKKTIIYYGVNNGKAAGFKDKGTYKKYYGSNSYKLDFDGKKAALVNCDDVIWFVVGSKAVPFERTSEVMEILK